MNLRIYNYNNYYNRIIKREEDYTKYGDYIYEIENVNFNPNDHNMTEQVLGSTTNPYSGSGDYVLIIDEFNNINSRWFIVEQKRERGGQWRLTLKRDLIADYYNKIVNDSVCFINKGTPTFGDPMIFNPEDIIVNQIKHSEYLLKDKSNSAWLVGYYAKRPSAGDSEATYLSNLKGSVYLNSAEDTNTIPIGTTLENWQYYGDQILNTDNNSMSFVVFSGLPNSINGGAYISRNTLYYRGDSFVFDSASYYPSSLPNINNKLEFTYNAGQTKESVNAAANTFGERFRSSDTFLSYLKESYESNFISYDELSYYNGKVIATSDNKFYKCTLQYKGEQKKPYTINLSSNIGLEFLSIMNTSGLIKTKSVTPEAELTYTVVGTVYALVFEELTNKLIEYDLSGAKLTTEDSSYNIFALPFNEINMKLYKNDNTVETIKNSQNIALSTIQSIQVNGGSTVYDIQLLPYCPVPGLLNDDGEIEIYENKPLEFSKIVTRDTDNTILTTYGFVFNVPSSKLSFNLYLPQISGPSGDDADYPFDVTTTNINRKVRDITDKWRLCSPNYSNYFDFSVEKNNGLHYFNVDLDLKPFTPYIHINPDFGGLYGTDFNDPRGLICGGEFSLTQISDSWINYQIQNKNYENIFKSTIQNMEYQNKFAKGKDIANAITGTVTGGVGGAFTGATIGGGYGAIAGAAIGTLTAGAGGVADVIINEKLRNQSIKYATEQYDLQLGNIQALPITISKLSSLTLNNAIWPVLEFYTCTDVEKRAVINKLAYNGMNVGVIGSISDYLNTWTYYLSSGLIKSQNFIQAQLIRLENIDDDSHIINEISMELSKGVYL